MSPGADERGNDAIAREIQPAVLEVNGLAKFDVKAVVEPVCDQWQRDRRGSGTRAFCAVWACYREKRNSNGLPVPGLAPQSQLDGSEPVTLIAAG